MLSMNLRLLCYINQLNFKDMYKIKIGRIYSSRHSHKDNFDFVLLPSLDCHHREKYHYKRNVHHSLRINGREFLILLYFMTCLDNHDLEAFTGVRIFIQMCLNTFLR